MIPDHLLEAPRVPPEAAAELGAVLDTIPLRPDGESSARRPIDLTGATGRPVWQLLVHAASTGRFALHGTASHDLDELEARQSVDAGAFGDRNGVYAAADGLWPYYFAIVDRRTVTSLVNTAVTIDDDGGRSTGPRYYFSVDGTDPAPWRDGTVYVLPSEGFEREPARERAYGRVRSSQLFRPSSVRPVARVRVRPEGFPLLGSIRRHDADAVRAAAARDPDGFPWVSAARR